MLGIGIAVIWLTELRYRAVVGQDDIFTVVFVVQNLEWMAVSKVPFAYGDVPKVEHDSKVLGVLQGFVDDFRIVCGVNLADDFNTASVGYSQAPAVIIDGTGGLDLLEWNRDSWLPYDDDTH